ncbi:MAG: hypothetical protein ACP5KA_02145 [Desulfurococcaceae archaeon]
MSEHVLKIIREEMRSAKLSNVTQQRMLSIASAVSKLMEGLHELGDVGKEAVYQVVKRLEDDASLLARIRLAKSLLSGDVSSDSVDAAVLRALQSLVKAEEAVLSPLVVKYGDKVAFLFTKECNVSGRTYRKNQLALLSVESTVLAYINDCGHAIKEPFYEFKKNVGQ